jgi:hypothetical protein
MEKLSVRLLEAAPYLISTVFRYAAQATAPGCSQEMLSVQMRYEAQSSRIGTVLRHVLVLASPPIIMLVSNPNL